MASLLLVQIFFNRKNPGWSGHSTTCQDIKRLFYEGLKGNCSGKKMIFFIPSIDRVCGSDAQEKKIRFFTWLCKEIQDFEK